MSRLIVTLTLALALAASPKAWCYEGETRNLGLHAVTSLAITQTLTQFLNKRSPDTKFQNWVLTAFTVNFLGVMKEMVDDTGFNLKSVGANAVGSIGAGVVIELGGF